MEETVKNNLYEYLLSLGNVDERLPECPDVADKWRVMAEAYLPDGVREFNGYPTVSLGWMMFVGMAMVQFWDEDWQRYADKNDIYEQLRDARGYDCLDEYILEDVLRLDCAERTAISALVGECASRALSILKGAGIEPGTEEAFRAYIACLHQLYLFGAAVRLKRLGYHMTAL